MNNALKKKIFLAILFLIIIGLIYYQMNKFSEVSTFGASVTGTPGKYGEIAWADPGKDGKGVDAFGYIAQNTIKTGATYSTAFPTSFNVINDPDNTYTGTSVEAITLDAIESGYLSTIMKSDPYIIKYMSNDTQWQPYKTIVTVTGTTKSVTGLSILTIIRESNGGFGLATYCADTGIVGGNTIPISGTKASINQALWIPAGDSATSTVATTSGSTTFKGTSQPSLTMSNSQKYRTQLILGVLIANHVYLNNSPAPGAPGGNTNMDIVTSGYDKYNSNSLLSYLYNNYVPGAVENPTPASTVPASVANAIKDGVFTYNAIHAIFLYVLARDAWLASMITAAGSTGTV